MAVAVGGAVAVELGEGVGDTVEVRVEVGVEVVVAVAVRVWVAVRVDVPVVVGVVVGVGVEVGVAVGVWVMQRPLSALHEAFTKRSQTPQFPGATGGPQANEPHWQHSPWAAVDEAAARITSRVMPISPAMALCNSPESRNIPGSRYSDGGRVLRNGSLSVQSRLQRERKPRSATWGRRRGQCP